MLHIVTSHKQARGTQVGVTHGHSTPTPSVEARALLRGLLLLVLIYAGFWFASTR